MIELDSMNMLYGKNVAVTFDNDCDHCEENHFYLPDIKLTVKFVSSNMSGTIIEDLSNDYCDFNSLIINYRICINSGGTNQCFENPCGNGEIYTSRCGSDPPQRVVSLETNGVENGAIISIFCFGIDCKGNPTNVMVFNIKIAICEEGSMCIEENQTGNTTNMAGTSSHLLNLLMRHLRRCLPLELHKAPQD
ncbi:hypothetical protein GBAR_LOCUS13543 [Geodia barretti]|uniref:Uncharacterized protein n=1 Tax=Geodia barretti TaxID=519541 RepID=A0AA35S461_GEOBA|nr:hypothetical protein GBAR_LOCUS13543 [Geodia barretti]